MFRIIPLSTIARMLFLPFRLFRLVREVVAVAIHIPWSFFWRAHGACLPSLREDDVCMFCVSLSYKTLILLTSSHPPVDERPMSEKLSTLSKRNARPTPRSSVTTPAMRVFGATGVSSAKFSSLRHLPILSINPEGFEQSSPILIPSRVRKTLSGRL